MKPREDERHDDVMMAYKKIITELHREDERHDDVMMAYEKIITELHDIALSLKAMSGRNVVKTNEPTKKEGYVEQYFKRSDPKDVIADSR